MIDDLDKSILKLLTIELPQVKKGEVEVSFHQPNSVWSGQLGTKPTLNLFLYDVRENASLRQHQWQPVGNGEVRTGHTVRLKRTPLHMDCCYLVSAWSQTDDQVRPYEEHLLLTECILALARHPVLRSAKPEDALVKGRRYAATEPPANGLLEGRLAKSEYEIRTRLANHDVLTNPAEIWSALENSMRAAFSYIVTLALDPWEKLHQEADTVRTLSILTGQSDTPAPPALRSVEPSGYSVKARRDKKLDRIEEGALSATMHRVDGVVCDRATNMAPSRGVKVVIVALDLHQKKTTNGVRKEAISDKDGRFRFRRLPPGHYMLLVGPNSDEPLTEVEFTLPAAKPKEDQSLVIGEVSLGEGMDYPGVARLFEIVIGEAPKESGTGDGKRS